MLLRRRGQEHLEVVVAEDLLQVGQRRAAPGDRENAAVRADELAHHRARGQRELVDRELGARPDALAGVQHLLVDVGRRGLAAERGLAKRRRERQRDKKRGYWTLTPVFATTSFHSAISFLICSAKRCASPPAGATPSVSSCFAVSLTLRILFTSVLRCSTTGFGRFFGPMRPCQRR